MLDLPFSDLPLKKCPNVPQLINRGGTTRVFGKLCFCPLPKGAVWTKTAKNGEFAFYPLKTRASPLRPPKTTKMTKWQVSLRQSHGLEEPGLFFPELSLTCGSKSLSRTQTKAVTALDSMCIPVEGDEFFLRGDISDDGLGFSFARTWPPERIVSVNW